MAMNLYAHNAKSASGKALADGLGIKRIKHENSNYKARPNNSVINWGATQLPNEVGDAGRIFNQPNAVAAVVNKRKFFDDHGDTGYLPAHTTSKAEAAAWFVRDNSVVVERHVLNGHSGAGMRLVKNALDLQDAPLYTKYIPKRDEFRVHLFDGEVIDVQQKKLKLDHQGPVNHQIRNLEGGYIYAREDIQVPQCVLDAAKAIFDRTGLDFGAVDVIYNAYADRAYVLEINTAPGLTGTTLDLYVAAFRNV